MRHELKALLLVWLLAVPLSAQAIPVPYSVTFEVGYIETFGVPLTDPRVEVGNHYFGMFTVDDSILGIDGLNQGGEVGFLAIKMENVFWCYNVFCPGNVFSGFRGPDYPFLGAPSPGFDVLNGDVVNLRGGVFGGSDFPFIDFSTDILEPFSNSGSCTGRYCGNLPNSFWTINPLGGFGGRMAVVRIPEPGTLTLLGLGLGFGLGFGLAGLGFSWRKKPK